jgi:hypothetical protein
VLYFDERVRQGLCPPVRGLLHPRAAPRARPVQGRATEFVYWDTGTAHLLPRLLRLPDGSPALSVASAAWAGVPGRKLPACHSWPPPGQAR